MYNCIYVIMTCVNNLFSLSSHERFVSVIARILIKQHDFDSLRFKSAHRVNDLITNICELLSNYEWNEEDKTSS